MRSRSVQDSLSERVAMFRPAFTETSGNHDRPLGSTFAKFLDEARHCVGRRTNYREIGRYRQAVDIRVGDNPPNDIMSWIYGHHWPVKYSGEKITSDL
jgi:hypothetical protein